MKNRILILLLFLGFSAGMHAQGFYPDGYIQTIDKKYTSGLFRGSDAFWLLPLNDPFASGSITIFQYMQGRVPGLRFFQTNSFTPDVVYRSARPAFFLNEIRVDAHLLASININDVALIKVFRPPFMGSYGGGNGAIAVYTRQGDEE